MSSLVSGAAGSRAGVSVTTSPAPVWSGVLASVQLSCSHA